MRKLILSLSIAALAAIPAFTQPAPNPDQPPERRDDRRDDRKDRRDERKAERLSGKIVSVGESQVVLRTDAGKEITFATTDRVRYTIDGRAAKIVDFKVGTVVDAGYVMDRDRYVLETLTVAGAAGTRPVTPAPDRPVGEGTLVEGTVVKVVGNDQIVVKTSDGKEITIMVSPQTKFQLTEQGGAFVDIKPDLPIRMYYDVVERRPVARLVARWRR